MSVFIPVTALVRFTRYLTALLRWSLIILVVFALTNLASRSIINGFPKVYTATARIQLRPPGSSGESDQPSLEAARAAMQSRDFLLPIILEFNLDQEWAGRASKWKEEALSPTEALAYLHKVLKIDEVPGTSIISVSVSSDVSKEAADIANSIMDRYKTMRDAAIDQPTNHPDDLLRHEIAQQQKVVDDAKAEIDKIEAQLGGDSNSVAVKANPFLAQRQKDLADAQADYQSRAALLAKVSDLSDDQFIQVLAGANNEAGDFNYQLTVLQDKAPASDAQVSALIARYRRAMKVNVDMAHSRMVMLQRQVNDFEAKTEEQSPELRQAQRHLEQQQGILDVLATRLAENTGGDNALPESPVRILTRAEPPQEPSSPDKSIDVIVTMVVAGFLGITVASFVEIICLFMRAATRTDN